jgi:hypothetical protein
MDTAVDITKMIETRKASKVEVETSSVFAWSQVHSKKCGALFY